MSDARRRGRPSHSLNPDASHAARLGAEIRTRRHAQRLTLQALATLIGFSPQHISQVERAKAPMSGAFVAACDWMLEAEGALMALLPEVVCERAMERHDRSAARHREEWLMRGPGSPIALPWMAQQEAGEDVDPISRRNLIGAGAGAAISLGAATVPASAHKIDPKLVGHWTKLMGVLARHDAMFGTHDLLDVVRRELKLIADHRLVAGGELHTELLRLEARWSQFASWLSSEVGNPALRDSWADQALRLAREAHDADMTAYVLMRRSHWAAEDHDTRRAIRFAEVARRVPGTSDEVRALCSLKEARGHALADDAAACERSLADASTLLNEDAARTVDLGGLKVTPAYVLADEARCWEKLQPRRAIDMLDDALRRWPSDRTRGRGLHHARLALTCAAAHEPERAAAEGIKALGIAQSTKSDVTMRELKRLDRQLATYALPEVNDFRAAFATL